MVQILRKLGLLLRCNDPNERDGIRYGILLLGNTYLGLDRSAMLRGIALNIGFRCIYDMACQFGLYILLQIGLIQL